jgi:hypothetical protein
MRSERRDDSEDGRADSCGIYSNQYQVTRDVMAPRGCTLPVLCLVVNAVRSHQILVRSFLFVLEPPQLQAD